MSPQICHVLIGPPGCGKSTFASQWQARSPEMIVVSTDTIREKLGLDSVGNWLLVEKHVMNEVQTAITAGRPVIYDATNIKRTWRIAFLQKASQISDHSVDWIGWWFEPNNPITLELCKAQNEGRDRRVPEIVIEQSFNIISNKAFQPNTAEGFISVEVVPILGNHCYDFSAIDERLSAPKYHRQNRYKALDPHAYSSLVDFERLMFLLQLIIKNPGIGHFHKTNPIKLSQEFQIDAQAELKSSLDEITVVLQKKYGAIYAEISAIREDLDWLCEQGILNSPYPRKIVEIPDLGDRRKFKAIHSHAYSDIESFQRLMQVISYLTHYPFLYQKGGALNALHQAMKQNQIHYTADAIRNDFRVCLKPYGIMSDENIYRQGYFLGTNIFSPAELLQIYRSLEGQAVYLDDPLAVEAYEQFQKRMKLLGLDTSASKPVRTIIGSPIVDLERLPEQSLAHQARRQDIEQAILQHQVITVQRRKDSGRFRGEGDEEFEILPIQIIFHNIAWYLGYKQVKNGLLRFERLDRLTFNRINPHLKTSVKEHEIARNQLFELFNSSYGLHLGNDPEIQQRYLKGDREGLEDTLELWMTESVFRFIQEGTRRFKNRPSYPPHKTYISSTKEAMKEQQYTTEEQRQFPKRLIVNIPVWSLKESRDFQRWVISFGGSVKVVKPDYLKDTIKRMAEQIATSLAYSPILESIQYALEFKFEKAGLELLPKIEAARYFPNVLESIYQALKQSTDINSFIKELGNPSLSAQLSDSTDNDRVVSDRFILIKVHQSLIER